MSYFSYIKSVIDDLPDTSELTNVLKDALKRHAQVFIIGNGGSSTTAAHAAEDFQKGALENGSPFKVTSLNDLALTTAWANDTDYSNVYSKQLEARMDKGDILIALSGSGKSPNILNAIDAAKKLSGITVGISGYKGPMLQIVDIPIEIPSVDMQIIEDITMMILHSTYKEVINGIL